MSDLLGAEEGCVLALVLVFLFALGGSWPGAGVTCLGWITGGSIGGRVAGLIFEILERDFLDFLDAIVAEGVETGEGLRAEG
jgi:hypothetical protein